MATSGLAEGTNLLHLTGVSSCTVEVVRL